MGLSQSDKAALAVALCSQNAANNIANLAGAEGSTPTMTTVTTTGDITCGGSVKIASGHTLKVNNVSVVGAQQTAVTPVAVTFTASTPATYGTPTGALTVADGTAPTVVELLKYCDELRGNIVALQAVLHAHGLTT